MLVSEHVTFIHLMSVFFGNPQPLQSLRAPLQQFINEHVLRGDQPTVANIDTAVARLLDDMREDITATSVSLDLHCVYVLFFVHVIINPLIDGR